MLLVGSTCPFFSLFLIAYFYDAIYDLAQFDMWSLLLCIYWDISPIFLFPLPSYLFPFLSPLSPCSLSSFFFLFTFLPYFFFYIGTRYKEISDFRGKFSEVMTWWVWSGWAGGSFFFFFFTNITLHFYLPISFFYHLFLLVGEFFSFFLSFFRGFKRV